MPVPLQAALLGVIQGVTEFLPISSTAHLLIGERLLGYQDHGSVFTEMIQLGSILAIVWLYRSTLVDVVAGSPGRPQSRRLGWIVLAAFVPAVLAGLLASDFVETVLHDSPLVMAVAFVVGGVVMLVVERTGSRPTVHEAGRISWRQALGIGCCQTLALIPGVSRSGATMVGGMAVGLDRPTAAEFSFFLAIPTMTAAFAHGALELKDQIAPDRVLDIAIGFVSAFAASTIVVKPFLAFVRRVGFAPFAWYRIIVGLGLFVAATAGFL